MTDVWVVRSDGGARGNPGPAGAGFVVEDATGRVIRGGGCYLGETTNNVAEYEALILGLTAALDAGATDIRVCADSQLIVRQVNGAYRVKQDHLKPLHRRACDLLRRFSSADVTHVMREDNEAADAFANKAMDARASVGDACGIAAPDTLF